MSILDTLRKIFEESGVDIYDVNSTYNMESIQYMTLLIEIENKFGIEIPNELLSKNLFLDIDELVILIEDLQKNFKNRNG